jgi:hypothetical protein
MEADLRPKRDAILSLTWVGIKKYATIMDFRTKILEILSSKLSVSVSQLCKMLPAQESELEPVLSALEDESMIHRAADSVTGEILLSPTSQGILKARGLRSFAS